MIRPSIENVGSGQSVTFKLSEACRLAGRQRTAMEQRRPVRCASPSPSASNTAFVISSTNSGMPSVRSMMSCRMFDGMSLLPLTPSIMAAMSRSLRRLMATNVTYGRPISGWLEFRPERHEQARDGLQPGPPCVALRRGRHRQIASYGGAAGAPDERTTHALAVFLLAAAHRQRLLPGDHQPDGTCRWNYARRRTADEAR